MLLNYSVSWFALTTTLLVDVASVIPVRSAPPPTSIAKRLQELNSKNPTERDAAIRAVADDPLSSYFFLNGIRDLPGGDHAIYRTVIDLIERKRMERTVSRSTRWVNSLRPDLLVEWATVAGRDDDRAAKLQPLLDLLALLDKRTKGELRYCSYKGAIFYDWTAKQMLSHRTLMTSIDRNAKIDQHHEGYRLVVGDSVSTDLRHREYWMVVANDGIRDSAKDSVWFRTVVFSNADISHVRFDEVDNVVVIVDGDIVFPRGATVYNSIFIANGQIQSRSTEVGGNYLWAGKSISIGTVPNAIKPVFQNNLASMGAILGPEAGANIRADLKKEPLGIQFFQLSDLGLTMNPTGEKLKVQDVESGSPFRRYDIRKGDLITHVDNVAIHSVEHLRRAVRTSYVREVGCLQLIRDGTRIDRVVPFHNAVVP